MAVHEGFHVNVQAPVWRKESGASLWPSWTTQQVNRGELATRCYGASGAAVAEERALLVDAAMAARRVPTAPRYVPARVPSSTCAESVGRTSRQSAYLLPVRPPRRWGRCLAGRQRLEWS